MVVRFPPHLPILLGFFFPFPQVARERLDTLTSLATAATKARATQMERIENLERSHKDLEFATDRRFNDDSALIRSEWAGTMTSMEGDMPESTVQGRLTFSGWVGSGLT